jgi:16S rRNA (guanine1207-N2)-methyltransferase
VVEEVETAALTALFEPFRQGALAWPERVAFLRARRGAALTEMPPAQLVCEQSFKPDADALSSAGLNVSADLGDIRDPFPLVLVLPPRQRDEARALLARAVRLAGPKGIVVAAAANSAGARSHEADLEQLCGRVATLSKHKCRVFWRTQGSDAVANDALIDEWLALDAPRPILDGRFVSRPGVFAWDRIDAASELLIAELPTSLSGAAADLGSGFGYLSRELLAKCPNIASLDVYEAEARALDLARRNLAADASRVAIDYRWHDVTTGLPKAYDVIVTNPPFHTSNGADDPGLGRRFIAAAAHALKPGGKLILVANRHLPYEAVLNASFGSVRIATQRYGFKIIEATRGAAGR